MSARPTWIGRRLRLSFFHRLLLVLGRLAAALSPRLALRVAERAFLVPVRRAARPRETEVLRRGHREWIEFRRRRIALWRWGAGPVVLLSHGWSGRGAQLAAFVEPLVSAGLSVLAWDAPGHGGSEGRRTSLLEFVALVRHLAWRERRVHAVIGHSLGAAAAVLACADGAPVDRVVFVGGTADPRGLFGRFLVAVGLAGPRRAMAMAHVESAHGFRWSDTDVAERAASLERIGALVIHDRDDTEVPLSDGVRVAKAWPGARLLVTEGLGHRRVLRDPLVVEEAVRFLLEGTGLVYRTEAETIERELWDRETRRRGLRLVAPEGIRRS